MLTGTLITSTINTRPEISHANRYTTHFKHFFYSFMWTVLETAPGDTVHSFTVAVTDVETVSVLTTWLHHRLVSYLVLIFAWDKKKKIDSTVLKYGNVILILIVSVLTSTQENILWFKLSLMRCSAPVTIDWEPSNPVEEPHLFPHNCIWRLKQRPINQMLGDCSAL